MAREFAGLEVLGKLGQGGMGTVYKARDPKLDRVVALKVMNPGQVSDQAYARFKREVQVIGKLRHPNIVRLLQLGQHKNRVFFTMDFIEGDTLAEHIEQAETWQDREQLVRHLATVAKAVHYAHEQGIIHRDLKPSNVMIDKATGEPVITDFGLAKELSAGQTVTVEGDAIGTVHYMSPEQAEGDRAKIGTATDIWSLGVILYEILTGHLPFEGRTPEAVLHKVVTGKPTPLRKMNADAPKPLEMVCLACLVKDAGKRVPSADALAADLDRALAGEHIGARRPGRGLMPLAAAGACLLALAMALWLLRGKPTAGRGGPSGRPPAASAGRMPPAAEGRRQPKADERLGELRKTALGRKKGDSVPTPTRRTNHQEATRHPNRAIPGRTSGDIDSPVVGLDALRARITSYYPLRSCRALLVKDGILWCGIDAAILSIDLSSNARALFPAGAEVTDIAAESGHVLWFTTKGAGVWRYGGRTWRNYTEQDGLAEDRVRSVAIDRRGRKWFGTISGGVTRFDGTSWKTYTKRDGLANNHIYTIAIDEQDRKWFGCHIGGVTCFDGKTWQTYGTAHGLAGGMVYDTTIDRKGRKWFGTGSGLSCFDGKRWANYGEKDGLGKNWVWAICFDADGQGWFGTHGGGLSSFDGGTWRTYTTADGLPSNEVAAIAIDPSGRIWIGTTWDGLCSYDGTAWRIETKQRTVGRGYVTAIAIDGEGRKWFGSGWGDLSSFDGKEWRQHTPETGLPGSRLMPLGADGEGIWFANTDGVHRYDGRNWKTHPTAGRLGSHVHSMATDRKGSRWFAHHGGFISRLDGDTWVRYGKAEGLGCGRVNAIAVDASGQYWVGADNGVFLFDGDIWQHYTTKDGLADEWVNTIAIDSRGVKWFGTRAGVSRFDGKTWKTYTRKDGLASSYVNVIAIDREGRKWFGTGGGVSCFDGEIWKTWTTRDFLAGNGVGPLAVDLDGSIWVGTTTGVSHIVLEPKE